MVVDFPRLQACKAGLACVASPAWVIDPRDITLVWANAAAVRLWRAESLEELLARDIASGAPEAVIERSRDLFAQVSAGQEVLQDWTFYPRGVATPVTLHLSGIHLDDDHVGVLNQALPPSDVGSDEVLRALAMFRHTEVMAALVDAEGQILEQNQAATRHFGQRAMWSEWFTEPERASQLVRQTLVNERAQAELQVQTGGGACWHAIHTSALRDPVSGELGVLVEHRDESTRIEAQRLAADRGQQLTDLAQALALVEQQRQAILSLSAPLLDVGRRTLAVPLVGRFDADHSEALSERLLEAVSAQSVALVILDLTGLTELDADSGTQLSRLVAALRLLGARPILTGIRPQLAQELLRLDFDFSSVETHRSLAAGLRAR